MAGLPDRAPSGALRRSREQRARRPTLFGRCCKYFWLPALAALALLFATGRSEAGPGGGSGNNTFTTSTTTSGTTTVIVPGNGALANPLQQALAGPNGALVAGALLQVLGPGAASFGSVSTSVITSQTIGPGTIPIGNGPGVFDISGNRVGPINCNGPPTLGGGWPAPNCNFSGYTQVLVAAGTTNFDTNTNYNVATQVTLSGGYTGVISGDLYTDFQITILDDDFRFIDALLDRGTLAGPAPFLSSLGPMHFAPDDPHIETPQIDQALGYANAPMATKAAPMTAPLGGGWSAWIKGDGGNARVSGDPNNFGFGYRTASGEGGIEYASGPWLFGGAAGYGHANVTQDVSSDTGSVVTAQGGAYAAFRPGSYVLSAAMTYAHSSIASSRLSILPMPSTAAFGANSFGAGVELSTTRAFYGSTVEPMVGLIYNELWTNSFAEAGDPGLDITGNAASAETLKGYVGARALATYPINGMQVTPELRARLLYDFLNDPDGFSASFTADPTMTQFPVTGIIPDRLSEMLGVSVNVHFTPTALAFVSYDAEIRGSDVANLFSGGVRVKW